MQAYPQVRQKRGSVVAKFGPGLDTGRVVPLKMVLDFDSEGGVVGIEIINLLLKVGNRGLEVIKKVSETGLTKATYAYDSESDSFYLRLKNLPSANQKSVQGFAVLDNGQIIGLIAEWKEDSVQSD